MSAPPAFPLVLVSVDDLVKMLRPLDLGRPMLSATEESQRPACAGAGQLFGVELDGRQDAAARARSLAVLRDAARAFCLECPVFAECQAYADEHREIGLWAGVYRSYHPRHKPHYQRVNLFDELVPA